MKKLAFLLFLGLFLLSFSSTIFAQEYVRAEVDVPKVDPAAITIDGQMNEAAWGNAARADLITATGFEIWTNKYYREALTEPDYDELYGRMLWADDTLYVFIHIDELVNDSTNLFWGPNYPPGSKWAGDQLFVSFSNRLGVDLKGWYDGNVYAAPDGPYHFLALGDRVTLNNEEETYVPEEYRATFGDSLVVFDASDIARSVTFIDTLAGVWNVEMAVYNPNIAAQASIGFNIGGSTGSRAAYAQFQDAYAYYTWQPSVPNDPYADPVGENDPGYYNLAGSKHWALLNLKSGAFTGIEEPRRQEGIPNQFALSQNYPNPFNPLTIINYDLPSAANVMLSIYNVLGQRIAILVNSPQSAGYYQVSWNAEKFGTGVYFYELRADDRVVAAKKMMLVK